MSKFKIGDRVRVKTLEQLKSESDSNNGVFLEKGVGGRKESIVFVINSMGELCGKYVTIKDIQTALSSGLTYYNIIENEYSWWPHMFETLDYKMAKVLDEL